MDSRSPDEQATNKISKNPTTALVHTQYPAPLQSALDSATRTGQVAGWTEQFSQEFHSGHWRQNGTQVVGTHQVEEENGPAVWDVGFCKSSQDRNLEFARAVKLHRRGGLGWYQWLPCFVGSVCSGECI